MNHYELLAVSPTASMDEIKQAHRQLVKVYHPDRHPDNPEYYEEKFKQIQAAFELLSDPIKRSAYDYQMGFSYQSPPYSTSPRRARPRTQTPPPPPAQTFEAATNNVVEIRRESLVFQMGIFGVCLLIGILIWMSSPDSVFGGGGFLVLLLVGALFPISQLWHYHNSRLILRVRLDATAGKLFLFGKYGFREGWVKRSVLLKRVGFGYGLEKVGREFIPTLRIFEVTKTGKRVIYDELACLRPDRKTWSKGQLDRLAKLLGKTAAFKRKGE
ncbi:MAG: J domain-containing protein [Bacteroidota bacterium]